jgi:hypothetical protein
MSNVKVYYDPILGCIGWIIKNPHASTSVKKTKRTNKSKSKNK